MLFPIEAVVGWAGLLLLAVGLSWRFRRYWPVWCSLGIALCGAIYYPAVMANRPLHYYALLEFLAAAATLGGGLVLAVVGLLWVLCSDPGGSSTDKPTEPRYDPSDLNKK